MIKKSPQPILIWVLLAGGLFYPTAGLSVEFVPPHGRGHSSSTGLASHRFFDTPGCERCHQEITQQWQSSSHRHSSLTNPYYRSAALDFDAQKGRTTFKFCAHCHDVALLLDSSRLHSSDAFQSKAAHAGIGCLVCHSTVGTPKAGGNGHMRVDLSPAKYGAKHSSRFLSKSLKKSEVCVSCHDVTLTQGVTNDRVSQGQDDGDAWSQSAYQGRGLHSPWPAEQKTCQDCHMPRVKVEGRDRAAKSGWVKSHRFVGANTALAHFLDDEQQLQAHENTLQESVQISLFNSDQGVVDVVLYNHRVGHRFPGGVNDSNQVWLDVEARDERGRVVAHFGSLQDDGRLPQTVHLIRAQAVDGEAYPLEHRDVQNQRGVVYDTSLKPLWPRLVRFIVPVKTYRLNVALKYRQFGKRYVLRACMGIQPLAAYDRCINPPVTTIARSSIVNTAQAAESGLDVQIRWAQALCDGLAADVVKGVHILEKLAKTHGPTAMIRASLAFGYFRLGRTDDVLLVTHGMTESSTVERFAQQLRIQALIQAYRLSAARVEAENLFRYVGDDRWVLGLLSRLRIHDGDFEKGLMLAHRLTVLDPVSDAGWLQVFLGQKALNRPSDLSRSMWLTRRTQSDRTRRLRENFRQMFPQRAALLDTIPTHDIRNLSAAK